MHRTLVRLAPALLFCAFHLPVLAQTALSVDPTACVYREGDAPRWAAADPDESAWQPIAAWPGVATPTPYYWLRCRFQPALLAPDVEPAIQVTGDQAYEIYIDGQPAGSFGNLSTGVHTVGLVRDYTSPALTRRNGPVEVTLRIAFTPQVLTLQPMPAVTLGDATFMRGLYSEQVGASLQNRWITWLCSGLIGAAGLFFFSLFWFDRSQTYLLWAGLTWISIADLRINEFLHTASIPYPSQLEAFLYGTGQCVEFCAILLFFRLADRPVNKLFRAILWILFITYVLYMPMAALPLRSEMMLRWLLDASPHLGAVLQGSFIVAGFAPVVAFWPITKLRGSQVFIAVAGFLWTITEVPYLVSMFPGVPRTGGFIIFSQQYRSVAILITVLTLTFLLIQRVRETNRDRATLAGEILAAQQIQRALVPASLPTAPGFKIEAVFQPAHDVGGDFYRCRVLPNGGQRILIGDVSGKGAAAAMTGAVLLGASEGHETESTAALLHHLNRVLNITGLAGFATCLCLDVDSDGQVRYANAGHLAPYRAGEECLSEPGLPLGLLQEAVYPETALRLDPGDTLTLLTDGVVEARNASGKLFGFDRTAAISTQSAEQIAAAAQSFGQDDDITVLTLTRIATGKPSTAPHEAAIPVPA
jgi:phosphoserine phosphatase RsbU/P